jgi:hypothetical protein
MREVLGGAECATTTGMNIAAPISAATVVTLAAFTMIVLRHTPIAAIPDEHAVAATHNP